MRKMPRPNIGYYFGAVLGFGLAVAFLYLLAAFAIHLGLLAAIIVAWAACTGSYYGHRVIWNYRERRGY